MRRIYDASIPMKPIVQAHPGGLGFDEDGVGRDIYAEGLARATFWHEIQAEYPGITAEGVLMACRERYARWPPTEEAEGTPEPQAEGEET